MSTSPRSRLGAALPLLISLSIAATLAACGSAGDAASPGSSSHSSPTDPAVVDEGTDPGSAAAPAMPPLRDAIDPAIVSALKAASVDVAKLPPELTDLTSSPTKLKAVMKTFTIALGTTCDGCHASSGSKIDYAAETPKKNVARKMWSQLVGGLQRADGSAIYCDSCHQGKMQFLDRSDDEALGIWMRNNFVGKLARRDGAAHGCTTCHGEPFQGDLIEAWSK